VVEAAMTSYKIKPAAKEGVMIHDMMRKVTLLGSISLVVLVLSFSNKTSAAPEGINVTGPNSSPHGMYFPKTGSTDGVIRWVRVFPVVHTRHGPRYPVQIVVKCGEKPKNGCWATGTTRSNHKQHGTLRPMTRETMENRLEVQGSVEAWCNGRWQKHVITFTNLWAAPEASLYLSDTGGGCFTKQLLLHEKDRNR
jgi:hypothetical protein